MVSEQKKICQASPIFWWGQLVYRLPVSGHAQVELWLTCTSPVPMNSETWLKCLCKNSKQKLVKRYNTAQLHPQLILFTPSSFIAQLGKGRATVERGQIWKLPQRPPLEFQLLTLYKFTDKFASAHKYWLSNWPICPKSVSASAVRGYSLVKHKSSGNGRQTRQWTLHPLETISNLPRHKVRLDSDPRKYCYALLHFVIIFNIQRYN